MKFSTMAAATLNTTKQLDTQSDNDFKCPEFYSSKTNNFQLMALYYKDNDEPDFDCEFLNEISSDKSENIIDFDSEDEQTDHFNDNQWDAEIYDPYEESAYY
jgi:hypothetical protein